MDSADAFTCNGYGFESLLAGQLDKESVHWNGGPVSECTKDSTLGIQFFLFLIELTNER